MRAMSIKLVTFDLDDTLWDVKPTLLRAEAKQNEWLAEHRPGCVEQYDHDALFEFKKSVWKRFPEFAHNISKMREQFLIELQLAAGYPETQAVAGAQAAFEVFLAERHKVSLYEGALQVLESLATGYRLGAITNGNADVYKTDAAEYFDFAILAEDVGRAKPAPEAFLAALERARVEPNEAVHVGDHWEHDVLGARNAGMHAIWLNSKDTAWPHESAPPRSIESLDQLELAISDISV